MRPWGMLITLLLLEGTRAAYAEEPLPPFDLQAELSEGQSITLEAATERALSLAPSRERSEAMLSAARAAVDRSREQLLPKLELSARYAHVDGFPDGRIDLGGTGPVPGLMISPPVIKIPRDQVALSARLSWPVSDLFFAVWPTLDAARAGERLRRAQQEAEQAKLRLTVCETYYQLVRARGSLAVARRALLQADAQRARIEAAVHAGIRQPAEASSAAARVAAAEQAVSAAEVAVEVADQSLRALLEASDGPLYAVDIALEPHAAPAAPDEADALLRKAEQGRAELRALREALAAQRSALRAQDAAGYPHLSLFVAGDYARPNRYVIPPRDEFQPSWEAGAILSYVPNETLAARRRHVEGAASVRSLQADYRELMRALRVEVHRSRATLLRAQRSGESARAAQRAAEDAYARRSAELRAGEVTTADLFAAESDLNAARLSVLDAAVEQQLASARLRYAIGQ